jgi:ketosteroid isomerase-like protein
MKRSTVFLAGLVSALALTAQPARAQEDAQELADRWADSYNRHDAAGLGSIYTERARLLMHGSPAIAGRAKIQDFWAGDFKDGNPLTLLTVP